ncbi:hypothetical protein OG900_38315 [Streptomyces sp. NBC_00433]
MTVLHHCVSVVAVTPEQFGQLAESVLDFAQSTRSRGEAIAVEDGRTVPDVRLVKGRHLRPGARYDLSHAGGTGTAVLAIQQWQRGRSIAVEQVVTSDEGTTRTAVRLRAPDRPRLLEADIRVRGSQPLRRVAGKGQVDLAAWWTAAALTPGTPPTAHAPATARLSHPLGRARLHLRPRRARDGRWEVGVTVAVNGRWLLRPLAAFALMVAGRPVRREFRSAVEQAAGAWDQAIGELLALSPDELRARLTRLATERTEHEPPAP